MLFSTNIGLPISGLLNRNCCRLLDCHLLFVQNDILFSSVVWTSAETILKNRVSCFMIHEFSCITCSKNESIHGVYQFFSSQPITTKAQTNRYMILESQSCLSTSLDTSDPKVDLLPILNLRAHEICPPSRRSPCPPLGGSNFAPRSGTSLRIRESHNSTPGQGAELRC